MRIQLPIERHRTLAAIAARLDEDGIRQAINITDRQRRRLFTRTTYSDMRFFEIEQAKTVIDAMVGVLPRLAELGREQEALATLRQLRPARKAGEREWGALLSGLARHVSKGGLDTLLRMSFEFRDLEAGVCALAALAAFLPADRVRDLIPAVRYIGYSRNKIERISFARSKRSISDIAHFDLRRRALHFIACRLADLGHPDEGLRELLLFIQTANRERTSWDVADTLAEIAPSLGPELLEPALNLVAQHDSQRQPAALQALASRLTSQLLPRALAIARGNPEVGFRAWGIAALLLVADGQDRSALASEALEIGADWPWILGLIGAFHDGACEKARDLVRDGKEEGIACLVHLLPRARESLASEMIALASRHYDDGEMLALSKFQPELEFRARLERVLASQPEALLNHDQRLASVSCRLADLGDTSRAYLLALEIRDPQVRDRTVLPMARALAEAPRDEILSLWKRVSGQWPDSTRIEAFAYVAALAPLLHAVGGKDEIEKIVTAIQEASRWWM